MKRQLLDDSSPQPVVDLRSTSNTNMKGLAGEGRQIHHKSEDLITRGWDPGRVRAYVECVKENKNLARQSQHSLKTMLRQGPKLGHKSRNSFVY